MSSVFKWGTVTGVGPLRVRLDGDTTALPFTPDSLVDPLLLGVGNRVRCELSARRLIVHGRSGGRAMRLPFPTKPALDAFTGWPGLVGFVEADNSEYVWVSGWKIWARPRTPFVPEWINWTTPGNSTIAAHWLIASGVAHFELMITVGSTASGFAAADFGVNNLPVDAALPWAVAGIPSAITALDVSAGRRYLLTGRMNTFSRRNVYFVAQDTSGGSVQLGGGLWSLFTPATGDTVQAHWSYPV